MSCCGAIGCNLCGRTVGPRGGISIPAAQLQGGDRFTPAATRGRELPNPQLHGCESCDHFCSRSYTKRILPNPQFHGEACFYNAVALGGLCQTRSCTGKNTSITAAARGRVLPDPQPDGGELLYTSSCTGEGLAQSAAPWGEGVFYTSSCAAQSLPQRVVPRGGEIGRASCRERV
mgnify:CR=1 FL=1